MIADTTIAAYQREAAEGERWARKHQQGCAACPGSPCADGLRIQAYITLNEEIAAGLRRKQAAERETQETLW